MDLSEYYSREVKKNAILSIEKLENGEYIEDVSVDTCNPLHLSQVVVNMNGKIYIINSKGVKKVKGESTGYGASLFKQYYDEDGNVYEVQEQFHKGYMYQEVQKIGSFDLINHMERETDVVDGLPLKAISKSDIWRL